LRGPNRQGLRFLFVSVAPQERREQPNRVGKTRPNRIAMPTRHFEGALKPDPEPESIHQKAIRKLPCKSMISAIISLGISCRPPLWNAMLRVGPWTDSSGPPGAGAEGLLQRCEPEILGT
jgi:hypothetical protein